MNFCEYLAIEAGGLTHWVGFSCDDESWFQICTGSPLTHAVIRDLPVMPLCSVCLASSDVEVLA